MKAVLFPPAAPELEKSRRTAESVCRGHGRLETRKATVLKTEHLNIQFEGAQQVIQVERLRRNLLTGKESVTFAYYITSLPRRSASAKKLLEMTRSHWGIENGLHYIRDVTFGEDACRVRKENLPQMLAAIRNICLQLIRKNWENCARGQRICALKPELAIALIANALPPAYHCNN